MSSERILATPALSRTGANPRQPRIPGRAGRAVAIQSTPAAARQHSDRPRIRAIAIAVPLLLAPALVLATVLVWSLHSTAHKKEDPSLGPVLGAPGKEDPSLGPVLGAPRSVTGLSAAIDPRLILQPRTVAQTVQVGEMRLTLTASPLVPGSNHFAVRLVDHGRSIDGARIRLIATMPGMAGRPLRYQTSAIGQGRYEVTGSLTMFGYWRILATVSLPGAATLTHAFGLNLDIPSGVLQTATASSAGSQ